jgi:hypothetical protein
LEIRRNWIQNPNFVIFIFHKKKDQEIIEILNNFSIKGNDFINNSNLDFNKSRNNIIFELNIDPSLVLYSTISKSIMIDSNSKEEDLLKSRPLIIDLINRKNKNKNK